MLFTSLTFAAYAVLAAATPMGSLEVYTRSLDDRAETTTVNITQLQYENIQFYVQHAAAAYCNFNAAPGSIITCRENACPLVQQNKATVVTSFIGTFTGIGMYVAVDRVRSEIVLSVRGTNSLLNIFTDLTFAWQRCDFVPGCRVHTGWANSWAEMQNVAILAVRAALAQNPGFRVIATGHSLGGAVATLAAAYLRKNGFTVDLYTYGSPRIGNRLFAEWMTVQPGGQWRVTHEDDPVPRVPPIFMGYYHVSPEYWLHGGDSWTTVYPISSVAVCPGVANTACNGGTFGLDIPAHLHYFGDTAACSPLLWLSKRDNVSLPELEQRLNAWSLKDQNLSRTGRA